MLLCYEQQAHVLPGPGRTCRRARALCRRRPPDGSCRGTITAATARAQAVAAVIVPAGTGCQCPCDQSSCMWSLWPAGRPHGPGPFHCNDSAAAASESLCATGWASMNTCLCERRTLAWRIETLDPAAGFELEPRMSACKLPALLVSQDLPTEQMPAPLVRDPLRHVHLTVELLCVKLRDRSSGSRLRQS